MHLVLFFFFVFFFVVVVFVFVFFTELPLFMAVIAYNYRIEMELIFGSNKIRISNLRIRTFVQNEEKCFHLIHFRLRLSNPSSYKAASSFFLCSLIIKESR